MDCLMSFPDFLYAFQTQLFYEGKKEKLTFRIIRSFMNPYHINFNQ